MSTPLSGIKSAAAAYDAFLNTQDTALTTASTDFNKSTPESTPGFNAKVNVILGTKRGIESISGTNTSESTVVKAIEPVKPKVNPIPAPSAPLFPWIREVEMHDFNNADLVPDEGLKFGQKPVAGYRVERIAMFSHNKQQWVTVLRNRRVAEKVNHDFSEEEMVRMYKRYRCQVSGSYRSDKDLAHMHARIVIPKVAKAQLFELFRFCGCDMRSCIGNAQKSNHFCSDCMTRY